MGKTDILTKDYISDNNIFADAFNYFMYDGKKVIRPEQLKAQDSTVFSVPYGTEGSSPVQKHRDILKSWSVKTDDSAVYLLLAIENQTKVHMAMPVRNMLYDALQYAAQVSKTAKLHKDEAKKPKNALKELKEEKTASKPSAGEYLSGFYASDRLTPVITLVVYLSADAWNGPTSLHEMLDVQDEEILALVPDYKINLIGPASMTKEEIDKMHTNLREVFLFIKYSKDKEKLRELVREDENFSHIDRQAVQVINAVTNSKIKINETEGERDMCLALDEMCQDAREEGRMEGGLKRNQEIIKKLIEEKMPDAFIMKVTDASFEELVAIKSQMM